MVYESLYKKLITDFMDTLIPDSRDFLTQNEISNFCFQRFFRCVRPFLSWLKKGETYWFEYKDNNKHRSPQQRNRLNSSEFSY